MYDNLKMILEKENDSKACDYYISLGAFIKRCERLLEDGFAYLVVILCHELYRYLYPIEPYANFVHTDPVTFAIRHIQKLIDASEHHYEFAVPYNFKVNSFAEFENMSLEKKTSDLYSGLWKELDNKSLVEESLKLINSRLPADVVTNHIVGKKVLDMGCGSGRYSIALAKTGAEEVVAVDVQKKSYEKVKILCEKFGYKVKFFEEDVLNLTFDDDVFDFVFCNGVLHHTHSIEKGLRELGRVLKQSGKAFIYLYAGGGIFWHTRNALRSVFKNIPIDYTKSVLKIIGMPSNRFIFCDTWYVPVEYHTSTEQVEAVFRDTGFVFKKIIGTGSFDLDKAIADGIKDAELMWGDGEHRYILHKE